MSGLHTATALPQTLSTTSWTVLFPWLAEYRSGPPILSDDELIPNAWLDASPAENLNAANFWRFCERVASRHLRDRQDQPLSEDFPALVPTTPLAALDLDSHAAKALRDNSITTCSELLSLSTNRLLVLRQVGRAAVVDILTALVAEATRTPQVDGSHSGALVNPGLLDFIESLDDRDRVILDDRIFASRPRTQAELARTLGLSRERVNQLDRQLRRELSETVGNSVDLRRLHTETIALANPVADRVRVAQALPLFGAEIPELGITVGQFVIAGSDALHIVDEWILGCSSAQVAEMVGHILDTNTGDESLVSVSAVAAGLHLPEGEATRWLSLNGFIMLDDHVINGPTATSDLVCAVLSIAAKPCTLDEIVVRLADAPRSRSSVRNALVTDDRIVKTDRTTYGLRRWGGEQYLPVHRQIGRLVDYAGGSIGIGDVIAQISDKYDVTESSIRAYAGAGDFVTRDEVVSRRTERYVHRKSPAKTRCLYREGDTVRWATTVAAAHLRGSAFNIPSALAGLVGVGPGTPVKLPSRLGTQSLMWVSVQARVGTIKRFVTDLGLMQGDAIFLEFAPRGFDITRRVMLEPGAAPVEQIMALMGRPPVPLPDGRLLELLADALFLPEGADAATVMSTLKHRKEAELAEHVAAVLF